MSTLSKEWERLVYERLGLDPGPTRQRDPATETVTSKVKELSHRRLKSTFKAQAGRSIAEEKFEAAETRRELDNFENKLEEQKSKTTMLASSQQPASQSQTEQKSGDDNDEEKEDAKEQTQATTGAEEKDGGTTRTAKILEVLAEDNADAGRGDVGLEWSRDAPTLLRMVNEEERVGGIEDESKYSDKKVLRQYFTHLDLSGRKIQRLDKDVARFVSLKELSVSLNELSSVDFLPESLQFLDASGNDITTFQPQSLRQSKVFDNMLHLSLSCNYLASLDTIIEFCPSLRNLDVSFNNLEDLQSTAQCVANLTHLQKLSLDGNPIALSHGYREVILSAPQLEQLDGFDITDRNSQTQYEKENYQALQRSIDEAVKAAIDAELRKTGRRLLGTNEEQEQNSKAPTGKGSARKQSISDKKGKNGSKDKKGTKQESPREDAEEPLKPIPFAEAVQEFDHLRKDITARLEQQAFERKSHLNGKVAMALRMDSLDGYPFLMSLLEDELQELNPENADAASKEDSKKSKKGKKEKSQESSPENLETELRDLFDFCCERSSFSLNVRLPEVGTVTSTGWNLVASQGTVVHGTSGSTEKSGEESTESPQGSQKLWEKHVEVHPTSEFRDGVLTDGCLVSGQEDCSIDNLEDFLERAYLFITGGSVPGKSEEGQKDPLRQELEDSFAAFHTATTLFRTQVDLSACLIPTQKAFVKAGALLRANEEYATDLVDSPVSVLPACYRLFAYLCCLRLAYHEKKEELNPAASSGKKGDKNSGSKSKGRSATSPSSPSEEKTTDEVLGAMVLDAKTSFQQWVQKRDFCTIRVGFEFILYLRGGWPE